jgi:hypothetical protein
MLFRQALHPLNPFHQPFVCVCVLAIFEIGCPELFAQVALEPLSSLCLPSS